MTISRHPLLFQINTRVWLTALSSELGRPVTLDDIPEEFLSRTAEMGFEWIWLLSVWCTGPAGQRVSRSHPKWRKAFVQTLPDLKETDIAGSGFAITAYQVHEVLGGDAALARLRRRFHNYGLRLMLDFVPNHTALDHPWVQAHPDYYITGSEDDLLRAPQNWFRAGSGPGALILAHGRDPFYSGWPDTLQLNFGNLALQEAMRAELSRIATQCDGVRCDMAMLVLPEIFQTTWGIAAPAFWPGAIRRVRGQIPEFCFMAEAYWELEWSLQQQGFDYTYDKRLYDRLRHGRAGPVREHLRAGIGFQSKLVRFLENHDEPRAAASFVPDAHRAAAAVTFLAPGLRMFHQGQLEGHRRRISPHLSRGPAEPVDPALRLFYARLIGVLRRPALHDGAWRLLECAPAWDGNDTWDDFIAFAWHGRYDERVVVAVNFSPHRGQCYVRLPDFPDGGWRLMDLLDDTRYDRQGAELRSKGLYLDEPAWRVMVLLVEKSR